jgi:hypothetical protein
MQTTRSAALGYQVRRSVPKRLLVLLVGLAVAVGTWFLVADGFLVSSETFSSARELVDTAAQEGVSCRKPNFTSGGASCLVGGHFTAFRMFDSHGDKKDMIHAVRAVRREGGGGNHLVIGDRWVIITASKSAAQRLGVALGGRVDLLESRDRADGAKKKR